MKHNFFLFKKAEKDNYLITNELGFFYYLTENDYWNFVDEKYEEIDSAILDDLKTKFFLYDETDILFAEKVYKEYRKARQYLFLGTSLHIFVITNGCNMNCVYCQAQDEEHITKGIMNFHTAEKAADIALQSPGFSLYFEFQGGEPLLNYPTIKHIIEYTELHRNDKKVHYSVVTNTLAMTEEMIRFFEKYEVSISTSLDGDASLHDSNRPKRDGTGSFFQVTANIMRLRESGLEVGAIQTTTRYSLSKPRQIVDAYLQAGLDTVFIRPLTPLGYAKNHWMEIGYTAEEFIEFYRKVLSNVIEANRFGNNLCEGHALIFLTTILGHNSGNYMELRSPCGAGVGQIAYYYDGNIYTCDEGRMLAEMGHDVFLIGNVEQDTYQSIMDSQTTKITCQSSILETLPGCCDCVYHPYCGVCPVVNYAMDGNIFAREANNYRCKIYKGILDILFQYIKGDVDALNVFQGWITRRNGK